MNKLLEALKGIERCCDGNNPDHEQIWHIANNAIKEAEKKQCDIHVVSNSTALEQLFNKCKQNDPTMTKKEFNEALDLWLYRWDKDQQIKQMRSEL